MSERAPAFAPALLLSIYLCTIPYYSKTFPHLLALPGCQNSSNSPSYTTNIGVYYAYESALFLDLTTASDICLCVESLIGFAFTTVGVQMWTLAIKEVRGST